MQTNMNFDYHFIILLTANFKKYLMWYDIYVLYSVKIRIRNGKIRDYVKKNKIYILFLVQFMKTIGFRYMCHAKNK